ncbi:hypothetical protein D031_4683A, partial [Vibrio parahaemolyticus VP-48]
MFVTLHRHTELEGSFQYLTFQSSQVGSQASPHALLHLREYLEINHA